METMSSFSYVMLEELSDLLEWLRNEVDRTRRTTRSRRKRKGRLKTVKREETMDISLEALRNARRASATWKD
jgi:hypothetical protein